MDLSDIQGLVLRGYRRLPYAAYVLLHFHDDAIAIKLWLASLIREVDSAEPKEAGQGVRPGVRLNVALTYSGLKAIGHPRSSLDTFPPAFVDGLGKPGHRASVLGDVEHSAPHRWEWGYHGDPVRVDALLLAYAVDKPTLSAAVAEWIERAERVRAIAPGSARFRYGSFPENADLAVREPFGFVDGISQPLLSGGSASLRRQAIQPSIHELNDGEFLLGHRDGSNQVTASPTVSAADDPLEILPSAREPGRRDLGYNGTYLVFRQLAQDVGEFSRVCKAESERLNIEEDRFRALLVGRWPEGSPIATCPIAHDPMLVESRPAANDFSYAADLHGDRCPIGAHIRRANPRDSLGENTAESWRIANRHRIIRRGRPYGIIQDEKSVTPISSEVGIQFICLNADIERQFEFIQQNWINDATFGGLETEDDPILGARQHAAAGGHMTFPPPPDDRLNRHVRGMPPFVTVKGGAYFFLPSLRALRYLATVGPAAARWEAPLPVSASRNRTDVVRALFLARFPLALAALLLLSPLLMMGPTSRLVARSMFLLRTPLEMVFVSAFASLAASVAFITFRLVQLYAPLRFGLRSTLLPGLTWWNTIFWQLATVPLVGTVLWLSIGDDVAAFDRRRTVVVWLAAAAAGYLAAFVLLIAAEALRDFGVRPANPEQTVIVPPSRWLTWLRMRPSFDFLGTRLVGRFLEALGTRVALVGRERGAGYVDYEQGSVLPGHLAAVALALLTFVIYGAGAWIFHPAHPLLSFKLPPLAYLLFLLIVAGWLTSGAAFLLDRFRVPLALAIAVWIAGANIRGGSDHEFAVLGDLPSASTAAQVLERADLLPITPAGAADRASGPIIVVASGGGGIHQAAWSARVLTGLAARWNACFTDNLRLISSASAGSIGAMHFVNAYGRNRRPLGNLDEIVDAAAAPVTSEIWWGFTYPDLARSLLPALPRRILPGTFDRAWAMEQAWERALPSSPPGSRTATLGRWRQEVSEGWRPAVAFNAMIVESGERAVLATYALPTRTARDLSWITDRRDISVITAARLSAAFPYVTPFARASNSTGDRMGHLTDGGYWDNYGIVTALEWLDAVRNTAAGRKVLIVEIPPPEEVRQPAQDRSWAWQQVAPLVALFSMRTQAQRDRNTEQKVAFSELWRAATGSTIEFAEFPYGHLDAPLGWHLSRRERQDVDRAWRSYTADARPFQAIERVLGAPGQCGN